MVKSKEYKDPVTVADELFNRRNHRYFLKGVLVQVDGDGEIFEINWTYWNEKSILVCVGYEDQKYTCDRLHLRSGWPSDQCNKLIRQRFLRKR